MKGTLSIKETALVFVGKIRRTTTATGVVIHKDSNGNIVRLISPQRNTAPLHYTIPQVFSLASRIEAHRNKYK